MGEAALASVSPIRGPRPFVKWAGGKTQLLVELRKHVPERCGRYFEPFVGGGALFWHLAQDRVPILPGAAKGSWAVLGDANKALVTTYKCVKTDVKELVTQLRTHQRSHEKRGSKFFYELREDAPSGAYEIAARFIALNKLSFNGLYRVNKSGKFNVPYGKWASVPNVCDADNLHACAQALRGVEIVAGDFAVAVSSAKKGDFVYFDPPYVPVSATSDFTAYTKEAFGPVEQERLRDVALRLKKKGVHVLLSNADVPFVRKLYTMGFSCRRVEARRNINSKSGSRGPVGELLIF